MGVGGTLLFKSAFSMDILTSLPWHQCWLSEGPATSWLHDSCKTWVARWDSISKHLKSSSYKPSSGLSVQMREETNSAASWNFISTNPGQLNPKFHKGTFEPASKSTSKGRAHRSACKRETSWLRFSIWTSHHRKWRKGGRCLGEECFPIFRLIHAPI